MSNAIGEVLESIKKNRVEANKKIEAIRNDVTLSPEGKKRELTKVYREGILEHKRLINRYKIAVDNRKNELVRGIYLHPIAISLNTDNQISAMRELVEKSELAYKTNEVNSLADRALGMRDKTLIRALGSVAYAKKDFATLEKLKGSDNAVGNVLDFERGFGELADASTKVQLNIMLRGVEKPNEVEQAVSNESV